MKVSIVIILIVSAALSIDCVGVLTSIKDRLNNKLNQPLNPNYVVNLIVPPATAAPITVAPITVAPITLPPVTLPPVTLPPITLAPITPAPITPAPITPAPITPAPITPAPITPAPITPAPITPAPVTPAPITPAPVTPAPITPAPVTPAPPPPTICTETKEIGTPYEKTACFINLKAGNLMASTLCSGFGMKLYDFSSKATATSVTAGKEYLSTLYPLIYPAAPAPAGAGIWVGPAIENCQRMFTTAATAVLAVAAAWQGPVTDTCSNSLPILCEFKK